VKEKGKNVADFDNEIKRGGALFAGRGNRLPPNGVNGVSMTDPTAPVANYATRYDSYDTVKLRADARSMLAQRNIAQSFVNTEAEGYDSGAEEVVDMPPMRSVACIPPGDFGTTYTFTTNGNVVEEDDLIDENGASSAA